MNCDIIQDLLPLYHDGVCSAASQAAVEDHLASCKTCREALSALDAPLPEKQKAAADDAAAVRKISKEWARSKWRARLRGAAVAAVLCGFLTGGWQLLANVNWLPVDNGDIEITDLSQKDGVVRFHLFVNDEKDLREVRYTYDENGNMYVRPLRPVLIGSRSTVGGLWDWDYEIDVAAYNETAEERGAAEVTHIYLGQGDDAILLWEEGMDLPAAGEKTDR